MPTREMGIDRTASLEWFRRNRRRSEEIFASVAPDAYYDRPIALRNPICFYEGHLPAFGVNTLLRRGLGEPGVDSRLERLFERGIDPEDESHVPGAAGNGWPAREEIRRYADEADRRVAQAIAQGDIAREVNPVLAGGLALFTILEHEPMHQETLAYMWHRLPYDRKVRPAGTPAIEIGGAPPARTGVRVPAGRATLGAAPGAIPFGWDNEFPSRVEEVPAFEIDVHDVTNRDYLEFVAAGGYERSDLWTPEDWAWRVEQDVSCPAFWEQEGARWFWRGMWERVPLPEAWPVYVSHAEASAYARWRGDRLPTEAEFQRAAYGTPEGHERRHPWGDEPPDGSRGNFDFRRADPVPVGSFPGGASAWGVHDLVGNGWEWTSSVFAGFPGFEPMALYPVYSSDFFDGRHFVMKGASPVTARELLRPTFRNWFRGNYPYVYATFRCVKGIRMTLPSRIAAPPEEAVRAFAEDVRRDLQLSPRQLQSKYLYDALGSALFEAICLLPWYRITRAEGRLLSRWGAEMVTGVQGPVTLVELGCGSGEKVSLIARQLRHRQQPIPIHLIDISPAALELSEKTLGKIEHVSVVGHRATYEEGLRRAARERPEGSALLVLFLGSNVGNFDPPNSQLFLEEIRAALRPGDALLLGADLVKPEAELLLAYDDPLGVTAAFNKNLLRRINTELFADFDLAAFDHRAHWNARERRVEMHLVSRRSQEVTIPRADFGLSLEAGETIWTESSYKYEPAEVLRLGSTAGFRPAGQWIEPDARFALSLFVAP